MLRPYRSPRYHWGRQVYIIRPSSPSPGRGLCVWERGTEGVRVRRSRGLPGPDLKHRPEAQPERKLPSPPSIAREAWKLQLTASLPLH